MSWNRSLEFCSNNKPSSSKIVGEKNLNDKSLPQTTNFLTKDMTFPVNLFNTKKFFIIVFENEDKLNVLKKEFFAELRTKGTLCNNYRGVVHPSQGNYVAMVSPLRNQIGSGVDFDKILSFGESSSDFWEWSTKRDCIANLLESRQRTWKSYLEEYPGKCFNGEKNGGDEGYRRKHNPFMMFDWVRESPERCSKMVEASQLDIDIRDGTVPDYSIYIPSMRNQGHNPSNLDVAENWFKGKWASTFSRLLEDPNMTIVITFDENGQGGTFSTDDKSNNVYCVMIGADVKKNGISEKVYYHHSLLKMIQRRMEIGDFEFLRDASRRILETNLAEYKHYNDSAEIDDIWEKQLYPQDFNHDFENLEGNLFLIENDVMLSEIKVHRAKNYFYLSEGGVIPFNERCYDRRRLFFYGINNDESNVQNLFDSMFYFNFGFFKPATSDSYEKNRILRSKEYNLLISESLLKKIGSILITKGIWKTLGFYSKGEGVLLNGTVPRYPLNSVSQLSANELLNFTLRGINFFDPNFNINETIYPVKYISRHDV